MNLKKNTLFIVGTLLLLADINLLAVSSNNTPDWLLLQNPMMRKQNVEATRRGSNIKKSNAFSLSSSIESANLSVKQALHKSLNRSYFNLDNTSVTLNRKQRVEKQKAKKQKSLSLTQQRGDVEKYQIKVAGMPLCKNLEISASLTSDGSTMNVIGRLPNIQSNYVPSIIDKQEMIDVAYPAIKEYLYSFDNSQVVENSSSESCWMINSQGEVEQYLKVESLVNKMPHHFVVSIYGEIIQAQKKFFDVTATITSYVQSPEFNSAETDTYSVEVDGSGFLKNDLFETIVSDGATKAEELTHVFDYDPSTEEDEFKEATAFQHINEHYAFFQSLGYSMSLTSPIQVTIEGSDEEDTNNAYYVSSNPPQIFIGNGDGVNLSVLALDEDVISHELGHHVVFESIKEVEGEALSLHEGLSDFFAYAKQNNPYLGESVCPPGSSICYSTPEPISGAGEFLRTADNDLTATDIASDGHLRGQVISGLLWDLREQHGVPAADVTDLSFKALAYMVSDSGFRDFLLSLFIADQNFFNNSYVQEICAEANERNMLSYIDDLDCDSGDPLSNIPQPVADLSPDGANSPSSSSRSDSSSGGCGVVSRTTESSPASTMLLLLMPLFAIFVFRKKSHRVFSEASDFRL